MVQETEDSKNLYVQPMDMNYRGGMREGGRGHDGVEGGGGQWDNCISIISKYI